MSRHGKFLKIQYNKILAKLTLILFFVVLNSCQGERESEVVLPVDESSAKERAKISETIGEISAIAEKFNYFNKFNSLPVLVTTEVNTGRLAYCSQNENKKGQFIVINRENFEFDKKRPYLNSVFSILLHEIGHCYFAKDHDQNFIRKQGYIARVEAFGSGSGISFTEVGFPTSIMTIGPGLCSGVCHEGSSLFGAVPELKEYYVSELLGTAKVLSTDDLSKFNFFDWIKVDNNYFQF